MALRSKKEKLGYFKWMRGELADPNVDEIHKYMEHYLRVHGWESVEPKQIDTLRLLLAAGKKIDLTGLDELVKSLGG